LIVIVVLEYLSRRQGREMKKPGATPPREIPAITKALKARNLRRSEQTS